MDVDPQKPVPLYFQVKTLIMEKISSGSYLPGDRLPTEQELCATFRISRTPVHRALAELADEGVLVRRRRHGTVVDPHWSPVRDAAMLRIVIAGDEWAEYLRNASPEDIELNIVAVGYPNLHRHITRAVAEGQAPDLMLIDSVWVREFAEAGILAPLDELAPAWFASDYGDFVMRLLHEGHPVAVAAEVNVAGIWFCRESLDRHGLDPPKTWDEMRTACRVLRDGEPPELPLAVPLGIKAAETTSYCLVGLLASNGAAVVVDDRVVLDSVATVETLEFVQHLVEHDLTSVQGVAFEWDRAPELLATGHAAFSIGGSYEAPLIAAASGSSLGRLHERFGFVALPVGPSGRRASVLGGMAYAIPRQSTRRTEAMRVLRALVSESALSNLTAATGTVPARLSNIAALAEQLDVVRAAASLLDVAVERPHTIAYNRVSTQLQLMVEAVALGRMSPPQAAARTADHIGAITGLPVVHRGEVS